MRVLNKWGPYLMLAGFAIFIAALIWFVATVNVQGQGPDPTRTPVAQAAQCAPTTDDPRGCQYRRQFSPRSDNWRYRQHQRARG